MIYKYRSPNTPSLTGKDETVSPKQSGEKSISTRKQLRGKKGKSDSSDE